MSRKNIIILTIASIVMVVIIMFVVTYSGREQVTSPEMPSIQKMTEANKKVITPENNIPKNNITIDEMTKEQADFAKDFAKKTGAAK